MSEKSESGETIDLALERLLNESELSIVRAAVVETDYGRQMDLPLVLEAWRLHVDKMEHDLNLPDSDRTVWGPHDLLAALAARNLAQAVEILEGNLKDKIVSLLNSIDEKFKSYTENDDLDLISKVDDLPFDSDHWWWHRIPVAGPIRRELNRIAEV